MRGVPPESNGTPGVYVHVPFCSVKCTYCDFPVAAGQDHRVDRYLDALEREIAARGPSWDGEVDSVYFGGGTPSRLAPSQVRRILRAVGARFRVTPGAEVSLEANPEDLDDRRVDGFLAAGVGRITVGVQSLDPDVLRRTGRRHGPDDALRAVRSARAAGVPSVGADLIGGLPGERLDRWDDTLARVLDADPDHVSFYLLEADAGSTLARAVAAGRERVASDDDQAGAYERTCDRLETAGYEPYEISNFARPGHRSRHNAKYWSDAWYAGYGLGAHAYERGARRSNARGLTRYMETVESGADPVAEIDPWNPVRRLEEALFLGLRRVEGIDLAALGARYGLDLATAYAEVWDRHRDAGALVAEGHRIRLTRAGRLRSNAVFRDLIGHLDAAGVPGPAGEEAR